MVFDFGVGYAMNEIRKMQKDRENAMRKAEEARDKSWAQYELECLKREGRGVH